MQWGIHICLLKGIDAFYQKRKKKWIKCDSLKMVCMTRLMTHMGIKRNCNINLFVFDMILEYYIASIYIGYSIFSDRVSCIRKMPKMDTWIFLYSVTVDTKPSNMFIIFRYLLMAVPLSGFTGFWTGYTVLMADSWDSVVWLLHL